MSMKRRTLLSVLLTIVVAAALVAGALRIRRTRLMQASSVPPAAAAPWAVHTAIVKRGEVTRGFPALASVTTAREITLAAQVGGTILEMGPREGVGVAPGEQLARIDVRELDAQVEAAKAGLLAAQAEARRQADEAKREERLLAEGGSSATDVERWTTGSVAAQQRSRALEEQVRGLEVRRAYGRVTMPVAGVIAARLAEPGDMALPGKPLYRVTTTQGSRVVIKLPLAVLQKVKPGCPVELSMGDEKLLVHVSRIRPSVDATALGTVEADLSARPFGLPSGARLSARVVCRIEPDALVVPHDAVLKDAGGATGRVHRVHGEAPDQTVELLPVTILLEGREGTAVEGAIEPGDTVVVGHESLLVRLRGGDRVAGTAQEARP